MGMKGQSSEPPYHSLPTVDATAQSSAIGSVHAPGLDKSNRPVGGRSLNPSEVAQPDKPTDRNKTTTAPLDAHTHASKIPSWNPFERYWSNKNSFPDYGKPEATAMYLPKGVTKSVKAINSFMHGNFLNGRSTPSEPRPTAAKRANDVPPTKPSKRQRTEDDVDPEVYSVPSSSEMAEQPYATTTPQNKRPHDSQSLRSSGDPCSGGRGVDELRSTNRKTGFGTKRSRHRSSARRSSLSVISDGMENTQKSTQANAFKPKRSLHHIREQRGDPIEDPEDVTFLQESRSSGTKGRTDSRVSRNAQFTASSFAVADASSDDELSAPRSTASRAQPAEQTQSIPERQAKSGKKRAAEPDDDVRQLGPSTKRRIENTSRADMHRTRFGSRVKHTESSREPLRISRAVCGPSYAYPAEGTMRENMPGASNRACLLVPTTDQPLRFKAVDEKTNETVPELEWLTPNIAKIQSITSNQNSGIVMIRKSQDFYSRFKTAGLMLLEFRSSLEAKRYIELCCMSNKSINADTTQDIVQLSNRMQNKLDEMINHNTQHPSQPKDIQLLERNQSRNSSSALPQPQSQNQQPRNTARTKTIREQMNDHGGLGNDAIRSMQEPKQNMTSAQERQVRDIVNDEYDPGYQERSHGNAELGLQTPSRLNGNEHEPRSQRSLRSTKPRVRSPSPVLTRWTEYHRDWAREWKTDLVYERTTVGKGDIERLDEGQLLNDEVISFYIKYLHKQLEKSDEQLAKKVYVFNSFFWDKLKSKQGGINYDGVKNWTAKVDLLSFDYIIVPINENAHWYLAIICNAKGLLQQDEPEPEPGNAVPEDRDQASGGAESMPDPSVTAIALDVSHISIEDDESVDSKANHSAKDEKLSAAKDTKASKKGPGPRKYDPKAPKVITLDSLGGPHSSVVTALKRYLQAEIEHKKGLKVEPPRSFGTAARDIPCQPNFTDCGVYLLGYMQEFMKDPDRFTRRILQSEKRDWDVNAPSLRNEIRELILEIQKKYQAGEDYKRRQRALAKKQTSKPQASGTSAPKSMSPVANKQPARQPSAPASSSAAQSRQATPLRAKSSPPDVKKEAASIHRDVRSSPLPAADDNQQTGSSQSQSSGPDATGNLHNVSMIVNLDESIERIDGRNVSKPTATSQEPVKSIECDGEQQTPVPRRSPGGRQTSRQTSRGLDHKTPTPAPPVYETKRFLAPIPSSPVSSDTGTDKKSSPRAGIKSGEIIDNKGNTKSPYFQHSAPGTGSVRRHGPAKGKVTRRVEAVSSSDAEGDESKMDKKQPSSTIDLTLE